VLLTCRYLNNLAAVEACNFKWLVCLDAFIWVEATLAIFVVATADYVLVLRQHQHMLMSTTNLDEVVFEDVERLYLAREVRYFD
jgi:hypothetical protein